MSLIPFVTTTAQSAPLDAGADAPHVSATTETGAKINLADVYSKNTYTLVFFYPKAFTGGCTAQSCSLRDGYESLAALGVAIIGVSTDNVETQRRFKEENRLPYTLLADTDKTVAQAFGQPSGGRASRQAYLIKDNKIIYADHKGTTSKQAETILAFIKDAAAAK
ncbi:peroxiredoxin [Opitutaceae bacterium TAV4]|nr:peroxiredoxin [Opitutaceae bacterium TAV4]RRK02872.1 peroxiredoxin [Opitutaceae bacterium TAV3]